MFDKFIQSLEAIRPEDAPHLHSALEDLCNKAGMEKPILCYVKEDAKLGLLDRFNFDHGAAALNIDGPRILIGKKFREIIGHENLHAPINNEFKAVLAHELGHIKYADTNLGKRLAFSYSPIMGFVAGLAGVWLYQYLKEKTKSAEAQGMDPQAAREKAHEEWQKSDQSAIETPPQHRYFTMLAKSLAGGLLGFAAGATIYSLTSRRAEFRADRFSAELMGDGRYLAGALRNMEEKLTQAALENPEILRDALKRPYTLFLQSLSHPSTQSRISHLESR